MPVDQQPCVGVWRPQDYEGYTARALAELPPLSPKLTELERFFYGSSHDVELDSAGRIMVPSFLAEHAGLQKDVVVVGAGERLELWTASRR
jgi:MraZ protein